jgi:short subunit dehydrogenase-like uncharacterized protein
MLQRWGCVILAVGAFSLSSAFAQAATSVSLGEIDIGGNRHALTVVAALAIADHVLAHEPPSGFCTPAALMGADFILTLPGTSVLTSTQ